MKTFTKYILSCIFLIGSLGLTHGQGMSLDSLQIDSLNIPTDKVIEQLEKLDSLIDRYTLDKGEKVTDSIDNIIAKAALGVSRQIDSLHKIIEKPLEYPKKMVNKADSMLSGITGKVRKIQNKIESKAGSHPGLTDGLGVDKLFDKCDILKQQQLMKDLPSLQNLKISDFKRSIKQIGIPDDLTSKLNGDITKLTNTKGLNLYLNNQLKEMGVPGTKEWKKAAKDPEYLDKMIDQKASQFAEAQHLQKQTGQLDQVKKITDDMFKGVPKTGEGKDLMNKGKKIAIKNAQDYLAGHEDKLQAAQKQLSKLKKKYSYIGSTNDMKNAKKAKSLEGQSLKRRLVLGGNFNLQHGNPVSLDLSPLLMYKLDKKLYLGVSGTFRVKLGIEDQYQATVTQDVYGYSAIGEYKIRNGFFGYLEFEYLSSPDSSQMYVDKTIRTWKEGLLIGIGKHFSFTKGLNARIIFTYNTLYEKGSTPAISPWNFKFGINTKKLSLKGIKL